MNRTDNAAAAAAECIAYDAWRAAWRAVAGRAIEWRAAIVTADDAYKVWCTTTDALNAAKNK